jgi:hypothetical protein
MGRSVNYLSDSEVIFFHADWLNGYDENGEYNEFDNQENWEVFFGDLKYNLKSKYKSLYDCDKWENRENHIFLENNLCEIAISEYCGLYSLSIRAKDDEFNSNYEKYKQGLSQNFVNQILPNVKKILKNCGVDLLVKQGTFSNGESVYSKL